MAKSERIGIDKFLGLRVNTPVIDVRSPSEFARGHVLNAINIPLFSDDERAQVGTAYKKKGREIALLLGLDIVGPQLSSKIKEAINIATNKKLLVYCWRGGLRSNSMAWLFEQAGIRVKILDGGYKTYRRAALEKFANPYKLFVLGGMTGSGKTAILKELERIGEQVVDLEGIANHKGSAFGGIGQQKQPTTEHFENILFEQLLIMDCDKRIWVEDESHSIGSVFIPNPFFHQMQSSTTIAVNRPRNYRAGRIEKEYASLPAQLLIESVKRIAKRLGGDNVKVSVESIEKGDYRTAIEICLNYYDKLYRYGLENNKKSYNIIELNEDNPEGDAQLVKNLADRL